MWQLCGVWDEDSLKVYIATAIKRNRMPRRVFPILILFMNDGKTIRKHGIVKIIEDKLMPDSEKETRMI